MKTFSCSTSVDLSKNRTSVAAEVTRRTLSRWLFRLLTSAATVLSLALGLGSSPSIAQTHDHAPETRIATPSVASTTNHSGQPARMVTKLPPLPEGVTELKFSDFFVTPVGPRGLELTGTFQNLDRQRVRMLGYMVHQELPPPGTFLFSPLPAQVHEHDNGLADDLPPSTLRVVVPACRNRAIPFAPGLMLLTGTLTIGNHAEADGRISVAQLSLDPPAPARTDRRYGKKFSAPVGKGAERLVSDASRP